MRLGFAILAIAAAIAYWISRDTATTLIVVCVVLILLPPSIDPAIQIKDRTLKGRHE